MSNGKSVWRASPSQLINILIFILFFWTIIIPFWVFLKTKFEKYELTEKTFTFKQGVLSQRVDKIELYRIRDYIIEKPFLMRLFGLGNLIIISSDKTNSKTLIRAIKNVEEVYEIFRVNVEAARKKTGTKEVDFT